MACPFCRSSISAATGSLLVSVAAAAAASLIIWASFFCSSATRCRRCTSCRSMERLLSSCAPSTRMASSSAR